MFNKEETKVFVAKYVDVVRAVQKYFDLTEKQIQNGNGLFNHQDGGVFFVEVIDKEPSDYKMGAKAWSNYEEYVRSQFPWVYLKDVLNYLAFKGKIESGSYVLVRN